MKIIGAKVRWNLEWGNYPDLEVLVDELPNRGLLRYQHKENCYFAELPDGYVSFYYWTGQQSQGYGGSHFPITMADGSQVILKGPWSSRCGVMNAVGFTPSVDLCYTETWGRMLLAGAMTLEVVETALKTYLPEVELYRDEERDGDITYRPTLKGMLPTESKDFLRRKKQSVACI